MWAWFVGFADALGCWIPTRSSRGFAEVIRRKNRGCSWLLDSDTLLEVFFGEGNLEQALVRGGNILKDKMLCCSENMERNHDFDWRGE